MIVFEGPGDLFKSKMQTIVIPVNTVGAMGAGLAHPVREKNHNLYMTYRRLCKEGRFRIDTFLLKSIAPNKKLLLFPTKKDWKDHSKLEWIESNLKRFSELYHKRDITSVAFPAIGCGHGNLEWSEVRELMYQYLDPISIPVEIVLRGGGK